jgi:hypothetical protein
VVTSATFRQSCNSCQAVRRAENHQWFHKRTANHFVDWWEISCTSLGLMADVRCCGDDGRCCNCLEANNNVFRWPKRVIPIASRSAFSSSVHACIMLSLPRESELSAIVYDDFCIPSNCHIHCQESLTNTFASIQASRASSQANPVQGRDQIAIQACL